MKHYFLESEHKRDDFFVISQKIADKQYSFWSCDNIFSKDNVDYGTFVLLNSVLKTQNIEGKVLDIGCGYGVIGIVIADKFNNSNVYMTDVNSTAVELSKRNKTLNDIKNIVNIRQSFCYENITENFDYIITNPPIKAGKEVLLEILIGSYEHLNKDGKLIFVIKKKFGEESIKEQLEKIFASVEIINRDSGYYILVATK